MALARRFGARHVTIASLGLSALALVLAPLLMPASYSWIAHTTSESAAQGVPGAWLARSGLVAFGMTAMAIALRSRDRWNRSGVALHAIVGGSLVAAATFSARPFDPLMPFAAREDLLHSIAATTMGFAFAFGVTAVALHRWKDHRNWRTIDVVAVTASVALPLAMAGVDDRAGLFQRAMFVVAYLWYGLQAARMTEGP